MKRTFKEKAVSKAAKITKKHRFLSPVIFLGLGLVLGIYNVFKYFYLNTKKYITIGMVLLFFFMSSSFATPDQAEEMEVYLSEAKDLNFYDDQALTDAGKLDDSFDTSADFIIDNNEIISSDLISKSEEIKLESTENIDTFTLSDFLSTVILSDIEEPNELSGTFDKDSWNLLLVNKTHPVPDDYEVPLATFSGSMKCDERVLEPLINMLNAAQEDNVGLIVCSPYRDYQLQEKLFLRKINAYMSKGYSYLEAYKISSQDVIMPGASEHQLGLAFDIVVSYHAVLDEEFGETKGGIWLRENAADYGFILRYPKGKEYITGIAYEPWHFRYVGVEAAKYIYENDLTLEEFLEDLD